MLSPPSSSSIVLLLLALLALALLAATAEAASFATSRIPTPMTMASSTLFDMPVSNHGARCRLILVEKGIPESEVRIAKPSELGGLKSEEYLSKAHPQGKMPALVLEDGACIPESDAIARYLVDKYQGQGPSFIPQTPELRAASDALVRLHDGYISTIQGAMYKAKGPFGPHIRRADALKDLVYQLEVIESRAHPKGPYLVGESQSLADATIFPTMVFINHMMPKFGFSESKIMGPRVAAWWKHMLSTPGGSQIKEEIMGAFKGWEDNGRWDSILGAGLQDNAPHTIFDKIIAKEIPSDVVHEDEFCVAFKDINPQAPLHVLIIPREREGLTQLRYATGEHAGVLGHMLEVAAKVARDEGLKGYRLVINDGEEGCQEVFHLHMHLLGGRKMRWPPG